MVKDISRFPTTLTIADTLVGSSTSVAINISNIGTEAVTIGNIVLATEDSFAVSSITLPTVLNPFIMSHISNYVLAGIGLTDLNVCNGFMFSGDTSGNVVSYRINSDGTLTTISTIAHGGYIYGVGSYDKVFFAARGFDGLTSYIVNDDGTFSEVETIVAGANRARSVFANADFAFIADDSGELHAYVYNSNGDMDLRVIESLPSPAYGVFADDNYVYVAMDGEIRSYLFDGNSFTFIDDYIIADVCKDICGSGDNNFIFVASGMGVFSFSIDEYGNFTYVDFSNLDGAPDSLKVRYDDSFLYVADANLTLALIGIQNDGTLRYLYNEGQVAAAQTVLVYGGYIYSPEAALGYELYDITVSGKLSVTVTFSPSNDELNTDTLSIASDALGSPDEFTLQAYGLGNAENGISSFNYYLLAQSRIAEQYKE